MVDDEPNLFSSLAAILRRSGYTVSIAANARESFLYLKTCRFDVILLDLRLKETSGLQLLPMFHRLYPDIPVIILTGDDSLETHVEAFRLGAVGYLIKPIDPMQILTCIQEIIKEQRLSVYRSTKMRKTKGKRGIKNRAI